MEKRKPTSNIMFALYGPQVKKRSNNGSRFSTELRRRNRRWDKISLFCHFQLNATKFSILATHSTQRNKSLQ